MSASKSRTWIETLRSFCSGPSRPKQRRQLRVEQLEDRVTPSMFSPVIAVDSTSGHTLRADIIEANTSTGAGTTVNTFDLAMGTYALSIANSMGPENAAMEGDLDLTAAGKTYIFQGAGVNKTFIDAQQIDRVFHVMAGVTVEFKDLTITGGKAVDNGTTNGSATGGGVLNAGGTVKFTHVAVTKNVATAAAGGNGAAPHTPPPAPVHPIGRLAGHH